MVLVMLVLMVEHRWFVLVLMVELCGVRAVPCVLVSVEHPRFAHGGRALVFL